MGVVYRARDIALDRDVAVKLLAERYPAASPAAQRFLSEARITGQLQHPGIPAVHQAGTLADGRPFLAMKLIKGSTLEAILKQMWDGLAIRPTPSAERGQLLGIFEAVCQAVGSPRDRHEGPVSCGIAVPKASQTIVTGKPGSYTKVLALQQDTDENGIGASQRRLVAVRIPGRSTAMTEPTLNTTQLHYWLGQYRAGDPAAADALLRATCGRLEALARKMLRGFPKVRLHVQTDDVLQNALVRLLRALETMQPTSLPDFFNFAAVLMRRELLDLARHFRSIIQHEEAPLGQPGANGKPAGPEPLDRTDEPQDLDHWTRFHEEVDRLPAEEREVVSLVFYHGWTQAQVAEQLGVTVRTVQRRWQAALLTLHDLLRAD
jgi:RNA polymerase sigma factor (sigma-70 family)